MEKYLQKAFLALIIMVASSVQAQIAPTLATQLQQILNNRVAAGSKGVSACVIMPNGDVWKGVSGVGQNSVTIADTTVFHGASITKANVATLILLLAENNLLHLDSAWTKYLNLSASFNNSITIRQLLNHTSGIKDYLETPASGTLLTSDFSHSFTPHEILETIVDDTPLFAPGTNFSYSTSNYALLALIAQTVTGNPIEQELHTRIWDPLGMTHTYFGGFETYTEPKAGIWWNFGAGLQDYSNQPYTAMLTYGFGGANIVTTPGDLAIFARALCTGSLLSTASFNQMKTFTANSYSFWNGYGLGVHRIYGGTVNTLGHDGYYTNMSDMFHSYDYGFTLVTMTNTESQLYGVYNPMYNALKSYVTTGLVENIHDGSMNIFPNPARDHFSIILNKTQKNAKLMVLDVTGKIILSNSLVETDAFEIDVTNLAEGVYTIKVESPEFTGIQKLIITR